MTLGGSSSYLFYFQFILLNFRISTLVQGCAYGSFHPQRQGEGKLLHRPALCVET